MPNGSGEPEIWRQIHELQRDFADIKAEIHGLKAQMAGYQLRQSQIPTWVWLGVTVLMTLGLWVADRVVSLVP